MKLLQNRLVVGLMVVAALALLVWRLWPVMHRSSRSQPPQSVALAASPAAVPPPAEDEDKSVAVKTAATPVLQPGGIEGASVKVNAPRWTESSQRDQFQVHGVRSASQGSNAPAMQLLKLGAIWRQTGNMLAVLNNRVVREGDTILGFTIETIGAEHVWVSGPNGREEMVFPLRADANFEYRIVDGVTNNVMTDPGWQEISGTVREKLSDNTYRVSIRANLVVVLKNVPFDLFDNQELSIRCKRVGNASYEARTGDKQKETLPAYDHGLPCDPPKAAIDRHETLNAFLLERYAEASTLRAKSDIDEAAKGSASAQYILGRRYLHGEGVRKDEGQGLRWLEKSAAQGNLDAQAALQKIGVQK